MCIILPTTNMTAWFINVNCTTYAYLYFARTNKLISLHIQCSYLLKILPEIGAAVLECILELN